MTAPALLLAGAGGHARACIDVIECDARFILAGLIGMPEELGTSVLGYPLLGTDADISALAERIPHAFVAAGQIKSPALRRRLFGLLCAAGFDLPVIVSPHARVSRHARIGPGTIVMHGAVVNAGAVVGTNCIVNSQALVEHDAVVSDHCHIATAAVINGGVYVGEGTFVGSGACVREGVSIGANCVIAMAAVVRADCTDGTATANLRSMT
jgi:sugar O-acyltransferase (sialic acid O-acetyltransferase NeuD family)